ncbi:MAG TPA: Ig-like domain-containing protein [Mycobacteriales bacterium]
MTFSQSRTRHRSMWAALAVVLVLPACSAGSGDAKTPGRTASPSPSLQLSLSPKAGATRVAPASRVTLAAAHGTLAAVAVVASSGDAVTGRLAADGTRWQSRGKLAFGVRYTVTATTPDGRKVSAGSFRTAARPDLAHSVYTSSVLGDHKTYGVGMPIILRVGRAMESDAARSAFERTLSVRSRPATAGAWGWVNSREVHFRPRNFWAAGSKVHVSVDSAGRALGGGRWGRTDLTVDFSIGARREMRADGATHTVTVIENGKTVRTMPASLGKPSFPSSSGVMVIMDKRAKALFDSSTYGLPVDSPGGYRTPVRYAMRLTWGGEFFHAAPWSVADQGHRNVSHGCINLSLPNAAWLFNRVQPGDPVFVRNTGVPVAVGNGWSDWTVPFSKWLSRSATGAHATTA